MDFPFKAFSDFADKMHKVIGLQARKGNPESENIMGRTCVDMDLPRKLVEKEHEKAPHLGVWPDAVCVPPVISHNG